MTPSPNVPVFFFFPSQCRENKTFFLACSKSCYAFHKVKAHWGNGDDTLLKQTIMGPMSLQHPSHAHLCTVDREKSLPCCVRMQQLRAHCVGRGQTLASGLLKRANSFSITRLRTRALNLRQHKLSLGQSG